MKRIKVLALLLATVTVLSVLPGNPVQAKTASGNIGWGIDVSRHNGAINWSQVASSGCKFAFIRCGNPQTGMDANFVTNITNASAAGLRTGVYYYSHATTVEAAKAEAEQTLAWISNYNVNYPVVYDVEAGGQKKLNAEQMTAIVNTYCSIIQSAGYYPVVYSYKNFIAQKLPNITWDKWVAQYGQSLNYDNNVTFWQYTSHGSVAGVPGRVDMDYQYKDYDSLIVKDGWSDQNGGRRYFKNWRMTRGFADIEGATRYFDGAGNMAVARFFDDNGKRYYADENGVVYKGQIYAINDSLYNFGSDGVLQTSGEVVTPDMKFIATESGALVPAQ